MPNLYVCHNLFFRFVPLDFTDVSPLHCQHKNYYTWRFFIRLHKHCVNSSWWRNSHQLCTSSSHVFTNPEFSICNWFFFEKKFLFFWEKITIYIGMLYLIQLIVFDHQLWIPNFCNNFFVYLLSEYFYQVKVLNQYHNTPKNANTTLYTRKTKTLCNTLQNIQNRSKQTINIIYFEGFVKTCHELAIAPLPLPILWNPIP
jgi:hypothetical protein